MLRIIRFNALLRAEEVNPAQVKLVRHQDTRQTARRTPYQLWAANDGSFEFYQRLQGRLIFADAQMLDIPESDYQVSALEVAASSASIEVLAKMESGWKQKLLSRQFGLNAN